MLFEALLIYLLFCQQIPDRILRLHSAERGIIKLLAKEDFLLNVDIYYDFQTEFHSYLWKLCPAIISNELQNVLDLRKRICKRHLTLIESFVCIWLKEVS